MRAPLVILAAVMPFALVAGASAAHDALGAVGSTTWPVLTVAHPAHHVVSIAPSLSVQGAGRRLLTARWLIAQASVVPVVRRHQRVVDAAGR